MEPEEIKAAKDLHYRKVKEICRRYADFGVVHSHTLVEELIDAFCDTRPKELHFLIVELQKAEIRLNELDKYLEKEVESRDENNKSQTQ